MQSGNAELRRYEDDLYVSGFGIIIMGIWSVLKSYIISFLGTKQEYDITPETLGIDVATDDQKLYLALFFLVLAVIAIIAYILHFYVGFNAMREAKGKRHMRYRASAYFVLIIDIVFLVIYPLMIYGVLADPEFNAQETLGASIIVDLTTIFIVASVIVSGRRIIKIKQKITE